MLLCSWWMAHRNIYGNVNGSIPTQLGMLSGLKYLCAHQMIIIMIHNDDKTLALSSCCHHFYFHQFHQKSSPLVCCFLLPLYLQENCHPSTTSTLAPLAYTLIIIVVRCILCLWASGTLILSGDLILRTRGSKPS